MTPSLRNILIAVAVVAGLVLLRKRSGSARASSVSGAQDPANIQPIPRMTLEPRASAGTQHLPSKIPAPVFDAGLAGLRRPPSLFSTAVAAQTGVSRSRGVAVSV